eukprot:15398392-Heterocapsa_arctica.AAC.1
MADSDVHSLQRHDVLEYIAALEAAEGRRRNAERAAGGGADEEEAEEVMEEAAEEVEEAAEEPPWSQSTTPPWTLATLVEEAVEAELVVAVGDPLTEEAEE